MSVLKAFTGGRLSVTVAMRSATARLICSLISAAPSHACGPKLEDKAALVNVAQCSAALAAAHVCCAAMDGNADGPPPARRERQQPGIAAIAVNARRNAPGGFCALHACRP